MQISNEKTGFTHKALTRKDGAVYRAVVTEMHARRGRVISARVVKTLDGFATRSKARTAAERACKCFAANHAFLN